jgi:hypothetical protein
MKRNAIALLVHPYKDCLLPRKLLTQRLNSCIEKLIESCAAFQAIKVNLVLSGFFLELLDPLLLLKLREMHKQNQLEWLFSGYTEPFLSFSPPWLLNENLKQGTKVFSDLAGTAPAGLVLPFSNWEPSAIDGFKTAGVHYCVVSKALLSQEYRRFCGYWQTDHMGSSIAFFPATVVAHSNLADLFTKLEALFSEDTRTGSSGKIICFDMLCNLSQPMENTDADLTVIFQTLEKMMLTHQTVRCMEFLSSYFSVGQNYLPANIVLARDDGESCPHFLNDLHRYDHVGILQRKLMDIVDTIASHKEIKQWSAALKTLFSVQDVYHYLPSVAGGFKRTHDRMWCYSKMIEIEQALYAKEEITGGHIRITDLLRNGNKTIVMSNKNLSLCIDYKNGGQVFEIDYKDRNYNLCAALRPSRHVVPMIVESPFSKTAFVDHCLPLETGIDMFSQNRFVESGDFVSEDFSYKIKKTASGIKTVLHRNGTLLQGGKNCPLTIEKVLGLEKDSSVLLFVYQLSNNSLTSYAFRFAIESTFSFPGIASGKAKVIQGKNVYEDLDAKPVSLEGITEWSIDDAESGIRVCFVMQKPIDLWCSPLPAAGDLHDRAHAIGVVVSAPVSLEGSKAWSLMGTMEFKKMRVGKDVVDEI